MTTPRPLPMFDSLETVTNCLGEHGDIRDAVLAGILAAGPQPLNEDGDLLTQLIPAGADLRVLNLDELREPLALSPYRKRGTVHVHDAAAFVGYLTKHGMPVSEVWADANSAALVGVINAGDFANNDFEGMAGHGDHQVRLELHRSRAWRTWRDNDKKWMPQQVFAEHIEDNALDITVPDPADMLEIAETLQGATAVDWKNATRLDSGQVTFRYEETITAKAGQAGDLDVPTRFHLAVEPFAGSPKVEIAARFRYRIRSGDLHLSYALANPEEVERDVYDAIVAAVADTITQPMFRGRPA